MKKIGLFDKIKGKSSSNKDKKHLHHKSVGEAPSNSSHSKSPTAASSSIGAQGQSIQAIVNLIHAHCKLNDNGSIQTIDMKKLPQKHVIDLIKKLRSLEE